ncbi:DUF2169 domain-containing protein [Chondromyces crocatus]|uniref:DUF2169 domain-containing protein n=1 Tax=Chondromyces crocatus TaxID=52 RepID=A0A0K1EBA4_CHOCO|nr:DUF2169 domain-containing protein [Chondromyces crocatus]AKT38161.1 uncharacterized protein CMC5_023040 [Chondromyces crocatus]
MDLALLCPFHIGVTRWTSPEPRRTVIIKATFTLDRDGELRLAQEQRPLEVDRPSAQATDELETASDFAPHKERVDVLLVGHAHAPAPASVIPAALQVGGLGLNFMAVASRPVDAIPLSVAHVRTEGPPSGVPLRLGPLSPRSPARRAFVGDRAVDRWGAPVGPLTGDFDFAYFNAAPLHLQLEALPGGTEIVLSGLLRGAPRRTLLVPRRRPLVYLLDAGAQRQCVRIGVRCDTVIIDTDRALLSLVWRGSFDDTLVSAHQRLLVAFEMADTRWSTDEVREQLKYTRSGRATESTAAPAASVPAPRIAAPQVLLVPTTPDEDDEMDEGVNTMAPAFEPSASAAHVLPFITTPHDLRDEPAERVSPYDTALPFGAPGVVPPPPRLWTEGPAFLREKTLIPQLSMPDTEVRSPPRLDTPASALAALTPPPVPARRASAPPGQELLPVDRYVAIRAELAQGRRREVLRRHGFDPTSWKRQEQLQIATIQSEALAGQSTRAMSLARALEEAGLA